VANALSVSVMARWGVIRTTWVAVALMGLFFSIPIVVSSLEVAAIGLIFSGGAFAFTNVGMNTCASDLEQSGKWRGMSACHGMWSLGAMGGSLLSAVGIWLVKPLSASWIDSYQIYMMILVCLTLWAAARTRINLRLVAEYQQEKDEQPPSDRPWFKPHKILWMLISISLCTYLAEGTMADWSAVYMRDIIKAPVMMIGWGFGFHALLMATGRFIGDELIARYGNMQVLLSGGILVVLGFTIIILSNQLWLVLPGFMLTGLGISTASPILYAAAARVPGLAPGAGIATMNSFAMIAFLGGPVLIGFLAKAFDLKLAFLFVMAAAIVWVIQVIIILRKKITA
jgi:predicted MFS family arabinose efflux permease